MNFMRSVVMLVGGVLALGLSGVASAACNNDPLTGAEFSLEQGGQGNLTCSSLQTPEGSMMDASGYVDLDFGPGGKSVDWVLSGLDVDAIIVEAADGKRCDYFIREGVTAGFDLTPGGDKRIKNVTSCADGVTEAPTEDLPAPIATATDCIGTVAQTFQLAVNGNPDLRHVVAIGQSDTGEDNLALCSADDSGAPSQTQCANRCVRPAGYPDHIPAGVNCTPDANGKIDLACRACELSSVEPNPEGVPYCFEFSHQVDELAGTYIPPTTTTPGWVRWEKHEGSACFLFTTTFFGVEYSYWTPAGCPN